MQGRGGKTPKIDLRLLNYLHAVAETGNITRAAERLNIAQPTLSKALRILEHQLGVPLLERHAHGVTLTVVGDRLFQHARAVKAQVAQAETELEQRRTGTIGTVRIGAGPSWVRRLLPEAIAQILAEDTRLHIELEGGYDASLLTGLMTGDLDFVVAEMPLERDGDYHFEYMTSDNLVAIARPEHPLAGRRDISAEEALRQRWGLASPETLARRKLNGKAIGLGLDPPDTVVTSTSHTFLMTLAGISDLLLYTTRSQMKAPEGAHLVEIDVPELVTSRDAGLIWRSGALPSPAAARVAKALKTWCEADPVN
ncbi:LysR family transcriptional regulator [Mameliella sediminis]|uniref:LysR family transcriptional regulator n=1 Tax=Mameliella sediminis TaxID=2836866 RepID=UPI001C47CFEC|nr:LysR family transcriptional regulator [Mameliella sediminis]MBY6116789.1 LysR family transcriptional regulator [Antarctobacter heliothermus]MBY6146542.1 LysR family transcriptional regulator [Mameliella alba]MBV7396444.1 LysR family transcriptional regulator [Mameliella sediminis]MBY6162771.1 LysR family transcriptional regulator [Mameliella alba]MBY6171034.1 LysR family transcriptional regulator [Mameliella alba]